MFAVSTTIAILSFHEMVVSTATLFEIVASRPFDVVEKFTTSI